VSFRFEAQARRRTQIAAVAAVLLVVLLGPLLAVPAVALVALVYYGHQLAAVLLGDDRVPYPALAFVIVICSAVVVLVQLTVFLSDLGVRPS
jgi:hypothetical protein